MNELIEMDHPLIRHHVARLRSEETSSEAFRNLIHRLAVLLTYESTKELSTEKFTLQTPLCETDGDRLNQRIGLIPILRAGLCMVDPILNLIPSAEVWHLGFYRDESTFKPVEYYKKFPDSDPVDVGLVLDPMLATGGSAVAALKAVYDWGVKDVKLLAVIAAPEGIAKVHAAYPATKIIVCAIDSHLDEKAYIVPGLGDAGDRIFNAQA